MNTKSGEPADHSAQAKLKRAADLFDTSVLGGQMPPLRSSSGDGDQQQSQTEEKLAGKGRLTGANLFEQLAAFGASQEPSHYGKDGKSSAGHKGPATGPHKHPYTGLPKLAMPEGQKSQGPLSARSLKPEGDAISGRKTVRFEKTASKQPQSQRSFISKPAKPLPTGNTTFVQKSTSKPPWSSRDPSTNTNRAETDPDLASQPSNSQQQQQNTFQVPRQPPWTKFRAVGDQGTAGTSASGMRQAAAGKRSRTKYKIGGRGQSVKYCLLALVLKVIRATSSSTAEETRQDWFDIYQLQPP